ncbi:MAG: PAS domain S-box protein [Nibricoccus sp.]
MSGAPLLNADLYAIGKILPGLFAVFEMPKLQPIYVNGSGLNHLDPAGTANFEELTIHDFIGMNDIDRFEREIYLQLRVRGVWEGDVYLRDMLGSEFRSLVSIMEVSVTEHGPRQLYLYAKLPKSNGSKDDGSISDEDMLHALLDTTPNSIYFKDVASRYLRISRAKAQKHGVSDPRESIGKTDFDYFTVEHAAPAFQDEQRIIKTGQPILDMEEKETFPDGSVRWVSTTKQPFYSRCGKLVGTFGISRDITVEKEAEEALREREALFRAVFDGTSNAVLLFSGNHLVDCNRRALEMFGFSREDLLARHPGELSPPLQPDGRKSSEASAQYIAFALEKGHCCFEWIHRRAGGEDFPAEVMLSTFEFRGRLVINGAIRDITEQKRVDRERREMEARLQLTSKLESVGSLAAGVAHEVNTPTQFISDNTRFLAEAFRQLSNVISVYQTQLAAMPLNPAAKEAVEAAEKDYELDYLLSEVPRCIEQSMDGLRRIGKIVGSLKEFSHPGGEEKSHANINRAIETTVAVSRHEWKYVADVVTELDPNLPKVNCVIDEINQAVLNLIVNASHAIEEANKATGNAKGLITIRTRQDADHAIIEVEDSGTGIPEHARDRIFEPFFTTKPVGKGTGQGLAIVQAVIVKKHRGNVSFSTELGKGTTFRLSLPLTAPAAGSTRQTWAPSAEQ